MFLILATKEFVCLSGKNIWEATHKHTTPEAVSDALVKNIAMKEKKDLELIVIKLVSQPQRRIRQDISDYYIELLKLYKHRKEMSIQTYGEKYERLYKNFCIHTYQNPQGMINYQTNDCLYDVLAYGFKHFCYIKKHFLITAPLYAAISSFSYILSFLVINQQLLAYFPKSQQQQIIDWQQAVIECLNKGHI